MRVPELVGASTRSDALRLVGPLVFEDAEGDLYEFAHGGTGGAHLGFAGGDQALIKGAHVWIVAGGGEGGQEQAGAPACQDP